MKLSRLSLLAAGIALLAASTTAHAQVIADRTTLNGLLATSTTEDFEAYSVDGGDSDSLSIPTLDSTTVVNTQGPGLVVPGVTFSRFGDVALDAFQWNGNGYFGLSTKTLLSGNLGLSIDFAVPTQAFGIDLAAFDGFGDTSVITVYAADDTTVVNTSSAISVPDANAVFYGFQNAAGIGKIEIVASEFGFGNMVDNLTFGTVNAAAAPEPGVLALVLGVAPLAIGVVRRRRSIN